MEDLIGLLPVLAVAAVVILSLVGAAVKVVQEYERGVIFRLGRLVGAKGPGLFFIIPFIDRMVKIDLRVVTLDIPSQEAITRDNVTVRVNAVCYFRVVDPEAAIVRVESFFNATLQIAQTTMRSVLGQSELDELLAKRAPAALPPDAAGHQLGPESHHHLPAADGPDQRLPGRLRNRWGRAIG